MRDVRASLRNACNKVATFAESRHEITTSFRRNRVGVVAATFFFLRALRTVTENKPTREVRLTYLQTENVFWRVLAVRAVTTMSQLAV